MSADGTPSIRFDGIGTVTKSTRYHYEVTNIEALAYQMFAKLIECAKAGRPLSDALMLQARISKDSLEAYLPDDATEADMANFGVRKAEDPTLSITKR